MSEIKALYIAPDHRPIALTFTDELESYQALLGGYIQAISLSSDIDIITNENHKFNGSTPNRMIRLNDFDYVETDSTEPYDLIHGAFLVIGADNERGEWRSLSAQEIEHYSERFNDIEIYLGYELGRVR